MNPRELLNKFNPFKKRPSDSEHSAAYLVARDQLVKAKKEMVSVYLFTLHDVKLDMGDAMGRDLTPEEEQALHEAYTSIPSAASAMDLPSIIGLFAGQDDEKKDDQIRMEHLYQSALQVFTKDGIKNEKGEFNQELIKAALEYLSIHEIAKRIRG